LRLGLRPLIESIPPAEYLRMSYYEKRLTALIEGLVASDLVTRAEIESGRPEKGSAKLALVTGRRGDSAVQNSCHAKECGCRCPLPTGPGGARPQHKPGHSYAFAALRAGQARDHRA